MEQKIQLIQIAPKWRNIKEIQGGVAIEKKCE